MNGTSPWISRSWKGHCVDSVTWRNRASRQRVGSRFIAKRYQLLSWLTAMVGFATLIAWCPPANAAVIFSEDFNSGLPNPNLAGYQNFTLQNGAIRRNGVFSDVNDRRYMRTVASNYNEVDFRYELTFTTTVLTQTSINFMGIGSGDRKPNESFGHNEPWDSLFFRIHTPNCCGGEIRVSNHPATDLVVIGSIPTAGTHRGRIEKVGNAITFSVDAHYNGVFNADMSYTFPNLATVAPFLNSTNSRLFFGTVFPNDSFDNMSITPEPNSIVLLAVAAILMLIANRRQNFE